MYKSRYLERMKSKKPSEVEVPIKAVAREVKPNVFERAVNRYAEVSTVSFYIPKR